jgi:hypothetical protein
LSFQDDLKPLDAVAAGVWVHYEGIRDKTGDLIASKVDFLPPKPAHAKAVKYVEEMPWRFEPPQSALPSQASSKSGDQPPYDVSDQDAVLTREGSVHFGPIGGTHRVPADQALQSRVRRIGMSLVPAYQKQLPPDDPAKIQFRFYALDHEKAARKASSGSGRTRKSAWASA